MMANRI